MCNFIPNLPGPTKHSKEGEGGSMGMNRKRGGNRGKFGGTEKGG